MFTITYEIELCEKVVECELNRQFRTLEDAKKEAQANQLAIAYRIFDKCGYRIFTGRRKEK